MTPTLYNAGSLFTLVMTTGFCLHHKEVAIKTQLIVVYKQTSNQYDISSVQLLYNIWLRHCYYLIVNPNCGLKYHWNLMATPKDYGCLMLGLRSDVTFGRRNSR